MENEVRYFLTKVKEAMTKANEDDTVFEPQYLVTATKLQTGAIEITVNDKNIAEKIDYMLEAYNDDMQLKTNTSIVIQNFMVI